MSASRDTPGGRAYLELRALARDQKRATDELLNIYALEGFLSRLSISEHVDNFVLKGGVLLSSFGTRRATRDVDLHALELSNEARVVQSAINQIAEVELQDGLIFQTSASTSKVIRDLDEYSGVRVKLQCSLAGADVSFLIDVNVGDAIWPAPSLVQLPRLMGGSISVLGYSIEMVIAEKVVTALQRGVVNTRWRDFYDVLQLIGQHSIEGVALVNSFEAVLNKRKVTVMPLSEALEGFDRIAQLKWSNWVRKNDYQERISTDFRFVLSDFISFADPVLAGNFQSHRWNPIDGEWEQIN